MAPWSSPATSFRSKVGLADSGHYAVSCLLQNAARQQQRVQPQKVAPCVASRGRLTSPTRTIHLSPVVLCRGGQLMQRGVAARPTLPEQPVVMVTCRRDLVERLFFESVYASRIREAIIKLGLLWVTASALTQFSLALLVTGEETTMYSNSSQKVMAIICVQPSEVSRLISAV